MKWKLGRKSGGKNYYATKGAYTMNWNDAGLFWLWKKDELICVGTREECLNESESNKS